MLKAAIYIRVSTKLQGEKYSLAAQKSELTEYTKKMDWDIVNVYQDIETGGKLEKEGLNQLLDAVESGIIDVVLCIDQDRLSRLDTIAWEYLKTTLRENNVKIAEPGHIVDLSNEDDEFFSDIKNLIAKREKKVIVGRMMRGKKQRTREGKGWGKPPFEYIWNKESESYEINEQWAWLIPFIDNLYLNENLGFKAISDRLNEICKTPNGTFWDDRNIAARLKRKAYHGVMEKKFASGEIVSIEGVYPPLRTKDAYVKIQREIGVRASHFKKYPKKHKSHLFRSTHITCGLCGYKINVRHSNTRDKIRHVYFAHLRNKKISTLEKCMISINLIRVEDNVIAAMKNILKNEEFARKYVKLDYEKEDINHIEKEMHILKKRISELETKLDRLMDAFLDGIFSKGQIQFRKEQMTNEINEHKLRLKHLIAQKEHISKNSSTYDMIYHYLAIIENFENDLTKEEMSDIIGELFPKGILFEDKLILQGEVNNEFPIELNIPIDPDPFPNMRGRRK